MNDARTKPTTSLGVLALAFLGSALGGAGCGAREVTVAEPAACGSAVPCGGPELTPAGSPVVHAGAPAAAPTSCAPAIDVVDRLTGATASAAISVVGGAVHATYWRCTIETEPQPAAVSCPGLLHATDAGGTYTRRQVSAEPGLGTSLWSDAQGTVLHAAAAGLSVTWSVSSELQAPAAGDRDWATSEVGASYYSPDVQTWIWADAAGAPRIAWVRETQHVTEVRQVIHDLSAPGGWRAASIPVNGGPDVELGGGQQLVAAYGPAGALHLAYARGEQTVWPAAAHSYLEYVGTGGPQTVLSSIAESFAAEALAVDGAGHAHLLLTRWQAMAQAPSLAYATDASADGSWRVEELPLTFTAGGEAALIAAGALAVDAEGVPHLAFIGQTRPSMTSVLVVGDRRSGSWRLELLDEDAVGKPALAVDEAGAERVAYFGKDTFKIARRCP